MQQTITSVAGPGANPLRPYRATRIRRERVTQQQIYDLWEGNAPSWQANYWERLDDTLHHLLGGTRFILPDEFLEGVEGREHMVVIFPQKITTPLKIINLLGNKRPRTQRYAVGLTMTASGVATDVDTWTNACLESDIDGRPLVNYRELVGRCFLEGAVVVKCLSSDAHWRVVPSWLDIIDEQEYGDLSPRRRRRYKPEEDVLLSDDEIQEIESGWSREAGRLNRYGSKRYVHVDREGVPVPKRRYHRDGRGRSRDHESYQRPRKDRDGNPIKFQEDRSASRKAYQEEQRDWLAHRLPFEVEIISARHCIPLMDDNERIEAILVMREYDAIEAIGKDLVWGNDQDMLIPATADEGGPIVVYELWHTDERMRPYAAYFVDGFAWTAFERPQIGATEPTTQSNSMPGAAESDDDTAGSSRLVDAVIDLQREYGCTTLPIRWFWGLHLPIDDVTRKAIPFLWPVLSSINAAEGIATAMHIYTWRNAFAGSFIQLDPQILERYGSLFAKNGDLFRFSLGPMENVVVPGRPQIAAAPDPGAGAQQLLQLLLQASAAMSPSDAAFGGSGSSSGHDRALSREYLEVALSQVLDSARLAIKFIAERMLEYAVWIAEKTGRCVPVYANTPISQVSTRIGETTTDIIELKPSWLRTNQQVHAYFENDDADELKRQQLAQQHMQGLVPWDEYRKGAWNDPAPEVTLVKIFNDQTLRTPEGRADVLEFAKGLRSDEQDQQKEKLVKQGLLSPDGLPTKARVPFTPKRLLGPASGGPPGEGVPGGGMAELAQLLAAGAGGAGGAAPGAAGSAGGGGPLGGPPGPGGPPVGRGPGADTATLPPGIVPPAGVPAALLARHLQLDQSHAAAKAIEAPTGPLGPIGGPANPGGSPVLPFNPAALRAGLAGGAGAGGAPPGTGPGGPVGGAPAISPELLAALAATRRGLSPPPGLPPGVEGPANQEPYPQKGAAAPNLPGMQGSKLGKASDVDSRLGGVIAAELRKAAKQYHEKRRGPRVPSGV
jgi:hypothetical protein